MRSFGKHLMVLGMILGMAGTASAYPSVFPTGVTINKPDKTCSGYTVLNPLRATPHGVPLIDMNGKVVHKWMNVEGQPAKVLPGGNLLALSILSENRKTPCPAENLYDVSLSSDISFLP